MASAVNELTKRDIVYDPRNTVSARQTFRYCNSKRIWGCLRAECGRVWEASCCRVMSCTGCPGCKHKTENYLNKFLVAEFGSERVSTQFTAPWCRHRNALTFDNAVRFDSGVILVELDGPHHFIDVPKWRTEASAMRQRDIFKMFMALAHGAESDVLGVVRLVQTDVFNDTWPAWRTHLHNALNEVTHSSEPTIRFVSRNKTIYDAHKANLEAALHSDSIPTYELKDIPANEEDGDETPFDQDVVLDADDVNDNSEDED